MLFENMYYSSKKGHNSFCVAVDLQLSEVIENGDLVNFHKERNNCRRKKGLLSM